jgi:hypothetical protein
MKNIAVAGLVLVASMVLGSSGWAQNWDARQSVSPDLKSGKTYNISGSISGAFSSTPGACSGGTGGFANLCQSGHTCVCNEDEGAKFTSTVTGKGTANVFITIDQTASYGFDIPGTTAPDCFPFLAEIDVTAKNETEVLEAAGATCTTPVNFQLSGIFSDSASDLFTAELANFLVNEDGSNGDFAYKMTFKGYALAK